MIKQENTFQGGVNILHIQTVEKAINKLHNKKGVEKVLLLDAHDRKTITQLEKTDEQEISPYFGKKNNIGIKQALGSDILLSFITGKEYSWPQNNLQIIHNGEVIGQDISDDDEIDRLKRSRNVCVLGSIVIDRDKFKNISKLKEPPLMCINSKPCPEMEELPFVSEAMIASPSRITDKYIKSKIDFQSDVHIGTFILGLNLEKKAIEEEKPCPMMMV